MKPRDGWNGGKYGLGMTFIRLDYGCKQRRQSPGGQHGTACRTTWPWADDDEDDGGPLIKLK